MARVRRSCSARLLSIDFTSDFIAIFPLTSEFTLAKIDTFHDSPRTN